MNNSRSARHVCRTDTENSLKVLSPTLSRTAAPPAAGTNTVGSSNPVRRRTAAWNSSVGVIFCSISSDTMLACGSLSEALEGV